MRRGGGRAVNAAARTSASIRIGVLGGGFGGVYTALKAEEVARSFGLPPPAVTLIDVSDRFVFKPLLYEIVTGEYTTNEVAPPFASLLARSDSVSHVRASVISASSGTCQSSGKPTARFVRTENPSAEIEQEFDYLVLAFGSKVPTNKVPGAPEHALPFNTISDAESLKDRLDAAISSNNSLSIRVAIVGGGYTGAELAAAVAYRLGSGRNVRIVSPRGIMPNDPPRQREIAQRSLEQAGVQVTSGRVTAVHEDSIAVKRSNHDEDILDADLVLWTTGSSACVPHETQGLQLDERGKVMIEPTLRAQNTENVFALGDAASSPDPATAQVALQQANYAAWNVVAHSAGKPMLPFKYQHLGNMMSLGPKDAAIALPIGNLALNGFAASAIRKAAYAYRMPTPESAATTAVGFASSFAQQVTGSSALAQSVSRSLSSLVPGG